MCYSSLTGKIFRRTRFYCQECSSWRETDLDRLCKKSVKPQVERLARTPTMQEAWRDCPST
ncbi:hypothetical protein GR211_33425 [Rhizobium leguminosarum]|nr:hypothetical protein [Rhizobium ruizarguesonis]NEK31728.1 hypothetical protein [Rhizobium ruizarguesonis]